MNTEEREDTIDRSIVVLSTGEVLKVKPVPPMLINRSINEKYPEPTPPKVKIKAFDGEREEYNPSDPSFQRELIEWNKARREAGIDLFLRKGIEIQLPKSDDWLEELREDDIDIDSLVGKGTSYKRLAYLKYYLIKTADDLNKVIESVSSLSTVQEAAIAAEESKFPGNGTRSANTAVRQETTEK